MFTGLIVEMGEIISLIKKENGARLGLQAKTVVQGVSVGDSIAVNGICLTVVETKGNTLSFDISGETLRSTNIGHLKIKDRVNLEPALRLDTRLGGHFVTGHIDGAGKIKSKSLKGDVYEIIVGTEDRLADLLVEKGSVAVDGISLTVVDVLKDGFSIVVIPHTAGLTTIGFKGSGDTVNIEVDILGKYVSRFLSRKKDGDLMAALVREGFTSET
jgi:riboflavin synthase